MITRQTTLSANLVAFCRFLRERNYGIGVREESDVLLAIEQLAPYDTPELMQQCMKSVLCRSPRDLLQFDDLYKQYWRELDRAINSKIKEEPEITKSSSSAKKKAPSIQALKNWLYGNKTEETTEVATYSAGSVLSKHELAAFSEEELREIYRIVKLIAQALANRKSRRYTSVKHAAQFDMRSTLRRNMRRGGEILHPAYRKRKKQDVSVVLICDVSKSMDLYSRFLIRFLYAFQNSYKKINSFVFSTSLYAIKKDLLDKSIDDALQRLMDTVPDWSGGTRIGASLDTFCTHYAHKMLVGNTIVVILSDGWDTGEADVLERSMRHIHRKATQVVWLNPLAGSAEWTPEVLGMKTAMPYIDVFAPAFDVESLRAVVERLRG